MSASGVFVELPCKAAELKATIRRFCREHGCFDTAIAVPAKHLGKRAVRIFNPENGKENKSCKAKP